MYKRNVCFHDAEMSECCVWILRLSVVILGLCGLRDPRRSEKNPEEESVFDKFQKRALVGLLRLLQTVVWLADSRCDTFATL